MDYAACNIVYVDRTAGEDRLLKRDDVFTKPLDANSIPLGDHNVSAQGDVNGNLTTLLGTFSEVYVCTSGKACVAKLSELHDVSLVDLIPTLVLLDIPCEDDLVESQPNATRTPSPTSNNRTERSSSDDAEKAFYGLSLLQWVALDIQQHNLSKLVVPVAVVKIPEKAQKDSNLEENTIFQPAPLRHPVIRPLSQHAASINTPLDQGRTMRYLDIGAVDVLTSPLLTERLPSLAIHAYRAHKEALRDQRAMLEMKRGRKRSWVGLDDQKPYAYLREAMVSGLMDGICRSGGDDLPLSHVRLSVPLDRREKIENGISSWYFSAHDYTDDELLHAALLMLQHALSLPALEQWRLATENLTGFLVACRAAYNSFVPYHNFRHVIDVLQACFHFLIRIGTLPPYPIGSLSQSTTKSPIAALLRPFDALTLLITAIGHDVGHPGVNNAFLVTLNAPLAQLYNDRSVLESFHCAAYSQILRRHWPAAFCAIEMRQLMISSILATDMGLHFDYMKKMGFLQEKLYENGGTDGWNGRTLEEHRTLACSLLIKCADISNVARRFDVAAQWTMILTDEFARQASMESDLGIPSALFAPPVREVIELGQSQVGFMNMFAIPLFQGVTDVMPAMQFCVDELQSNKAKWAVRIEEEQARQRKDSDDSVTMDGMFSPRAMSLANPSDIAHRQTKQGSNHQSSKSLSNIDDPSHKPTLTFMDGFKMDKFKGLSDLPEDDSEVHPMDDLSTDTLIPAAYSTARRTSKPTPSQLQLSYDTSSAPGLLDHASQAKDSSENGLDVEPSLATDVVVRDEATPTPRYEPTTPGQQRSSDTTDGNTSVVGSNDWASQATSATTSKLPLSPSTQGTSITSIESTERKPRTAPDQTSSTDTSTMAAPQEHPVTPATHTYTPPPMPESEGTRNGNIMQAMRTLAKKPSRSRFRFWKKKGSINGVNGVNGTATPPTNGEEQAVTENGNGSPNGRAS